MSLPTFHPVPRLFRRLVTLALASAFLAFNITTAHTQDPAPPGSAWLVDWDFENGWADAARLEPCLDTVQVFAAYFDHEGRLVLPEPIRKWLDSPTAADYPGEKLLLSVVNDLDSYGEKPVLKDPDLITRLMATRESRQRHKQDLLALLASNRFGGLELDYERVKITDWPRYLDFCRDLAAELKGMGKRLRVVLEPKRDYYRTRFPEGPEYSVMAYNLFGNHSGPGPKANAAFIEQMYQQCRSAGLKQPRLALATGGFDWAGEKDAKGIGEHQAVLLAEKHGVKPLRQADSRYMVFNYETPDGKKHEVWYADGHTIAYLRRVARAYGFDQIDLWRLGGNAPESLKIIQEAILEVRKRAAYFRETPEKAPRRDLYVAPAIASDVTPPCLPPDGTPPHTSIAAALAAAAPGDRIILSPGVYCENVVVDRPGLVITAPPESVTDAPVRIVGVTNSEATLLDLADTVWRGVVFTNPNGPNVLSLVNSTSRFEHCRIEAEAPPQRPAAAEGADCVDDPRDDSESTVTSSIPGAAAFENFAVYISGGEPSFHATAFTGKGGLGLRVAITLPESTLPNRRIDFTYCLFEGFTEGLLLAMGDVDFRFGNCLLSRNGMAVRGGGGGGYQGEVNFFNSILYHNLTAEITDATPPALLAHCLYTPVFNSRLWSMGTPLDGAFLEASRPLSPRFADVGRKVLIGLGIDDVANAGVWRDLTRLGDAYGYKLTWAINTGAALAAAEPAAGEGGDGDIWATARDGFARGHEIASHTGSHTPVTMTAPLAVSYYRPNLREAWLEIDPDGRLTVTADGKTVYTNNLSDGKTNIGVLFRELGRAGLVCDFSPYYAGVPAAHLARGVRLDILFPKGKVPLAIDLDRYLDYELGSSLATLREKLPKIKEFVFVHPYSISSLMSKQAIARTGYIASRTGLIADDQGMDRDDGTGATARMNVFGLPGQALGNMRGVLAEGDGMEEKLRLVLDYCRLQFSALVFYSHRWEEFKREEWETLMRLLRDDGNFRVVTLKEMKDEVMARGREVEPLVYEYPLEERKRDYRPRADSPVFAAGMDLGLKGDFAGNPLPENGRPAVGLYEK